MGWQGHHQPAHSIDTPPLASSSAGHPTASLPSPLSPSTTQPQQTRFTPACSREASLTWATSNPEEVSASFGSRVQLGTHTQPHLPGNPYQPAVGSDIPLEACAWVLALQLLEVTFPGNQRHPFSLPSQQAAPGMVPSAGMGRQDGDAGQSGSCCRQVTPYQLDVLYPCVSCWESGACSGSCFVNRAVPSLAMQCCNFLSIIP